MGPDLRRGRPDPQPQDDPLHGGALPARRALARRPARLARSRCAWRGGCSTRWPPSGSSTPSWSCGPKAPLDPLRRPRATTRRSRIPARVAEALQARAGRLNEPLDHPRGRRYTGALRPDRRGSDSRRCGLIFRRIAGIFVRRAKPTKRRRNRGELARETLITPEGLEKLKEELEYLENDKRREVADRIKQAREFGDIAENSEYDDAKNEQAMLEQRIASLQDRLRRAAVIDKKQHRHRDRRRRRGRPRQGPEVRQVAEVPDRRVRRGRTRSSRSSRTSRRSARRWSASKKNEVVTVETPRGPKKKLKVTKIETALQARQ